MNVPYIPIKQFGKGVDFSYGFSQPSVPIVPDPTKFVGSDIGFGNFSNVSFPITPDPNFLWQPEIDQLEAMIDDTNFEQPSLSGSLALVGVDRPSVEFQEGFGELLVPFVSPLLYGVNKVFGASRYTGSNRKKRRLELLSAVDNPIRPPVEEEGGFKSFMPQDNEGRIRQLVGMARNQRIDPGMVRARKPFTNSQIRAARSRMYGLKGNGNGGIKKKLFTRQIIPGKTGVPQRGVNYGSRGHYTNNNGSSGGYVQRSSRTAYYPGRPNGRGERAIQRWGTSGQAVSGSDINATAMKGENYTLKKSPAGQNHVVAKVYLGTISYGNAATGGNGVVVWPANGGTNIGGQYYFCPRVGTYVANTNILYKTADNYDKYRVLGGKFTFIPCISGFSNPDIRVAALVTPNIDHFARMSNTAFVGTPVPSTGNSTPLRATLMTNPNACAVPGWITQFQCPIPASGWKSVFSPDGLSGSFDYTNSMASQRQCYAFSMGLSITGAIPATVDLPVMECWMDISVVFSGQAYSVSKDSTFFTEQKMLTSLTPEEIKEIREKKMAEVNPGDELKLFFETFTTRKAQEIVLDRLMQDLGPDSKLSQVSKDIITESRASKHEDLARRRLRAQNHPDDIDVLRKNRDLADVYWEEGSDDFQRLRINNLADIDDNKSDIVKKKSTSVKSNTSQK